MTKRINVEEVWKSKADGEFYGMQSGAHYDESEVEKIGYCHWTKPAPPPGEVTYEAEEGPHSRSSHAEEHTKEY